MKNWDNAFENGAYIADADAYPAKWAALAQAFRNVANDAEIDLPYGDGAREKFDLFWPGARPKGLAVFVHGGYWMEFNKNSWSHMAAGACARGWAVAIPSYPFAPDMRVRDITTQVGRAIGAAAARVSGPIRLAGHSAGGHLVTRMACQSGPLDAVSRARLTHVLSISGLHDLRKLRHTTMNGTLRLTKAEAVNESAALQAPMPNIDVTAWVGGDERPEFLRQSQFLADNWQLAGCDVTVLTDPGRHHFNVVAGLALQNAPITSAFTGSK